MEVDNCVLEIGVTHNEFEDEHEEISEKSLTFGLDDGSKMEVEEIPEDKGNIRSTDKQVDLRKKIIEKSKRNGGNDDRKKTREESNEKWNGSSEERRTKYKKSKLKMRHHEKESRKLNDDKLFKPLDASPDLDPKILGREIAYRLGEPKVGLMGNVVKVLGFKVAMEILEDTRRIEKRGGMLTVDGARRRMPGGVFIYCLKENGYTTKEQVAEIFKEEKERLKDVQKRKRQQQNLKKRKELEDMKGLKERASKYVNKNLEQNDENMDKTSEKIKREEEIKEAQVKESLEKKTPIVVDNDTESNNGFEF